MRVQRKNLSTRKILTLSLFSFPDQNYRAGMSKLHFTSAKDNNQWMVLLKTQPELSNYRRNQSGRKRERFLFSYKKTTPVDFGENVLECLKKCFVQIISFGNVYLSYLAYKEPEETCCPWNTFSNKKIVDRGRDGRNPAGDFFKKTDRFLKTKENEVHCLREFTGFFTTKTHAGFQLFLRTYFRCWFYPNFHLSNGNFT